MEPAFANHLTGLLIANSGLPYEPAIGLLPPPLTGLLVTRPLLAWPSAPLFLGLRLAPTRLLDCW